MQCDNFEEIGGNNPLVSIIVITYNSAKFVLETLESIRVQTYKNIELIVTDDGSTDDTVEICQLWIDNHKNRFVRTEQITVKENTGIPANCNRGVKAALGEWVKLIAGDDVLLPSAVSDVIQFVYTNKDIQILDSKGLVYNQDITTEIGFFDYENSVFNRKHNTALDQFKIFTRNLNKKRVISTVGVYFHKDLFKKVGGFDERYRLLEDGPFFFKVLKSNVKFYYLNKLTFIYRRHDETVSSLFNQNSNNQIITEFRLTGEQFIRVDFYKEVPVLYKLDILWMKSMTKIVILFGNRAFILRLLLKISNKIRPINLFCLKPD